MLGELRHSKGSICVVYSICLKGSVCLYCLNSLEILQKGFSSVLARCLNKLHVFRHITINLIGTKRATILSKRTGYYSKQKSRLQLGSGEGFGGGSRESLFTQSPGCRQGLLGLVTAWKEDATSGSQRDQRRDRSEERLKWTRRHVPRRATANSDAKAGIRGRVTPAWRAGEVRAAGPAQ